MLKGKVFQVVLVVTMLMMAFVASTPQMIVNLVNFNIDGIYEIIMFTGFIVSFMVTYGRSRIMATIVLFAVGMLIPTAFLCKWTYSYFAMYSITSFALAVVIIVFLITMIGKTVDD